MKKTIFSLLLLIFLLNQDVFAQVATIHRDDCFNGRRQTLGTGNFNQGNLTIGNDRLTSVNMSSNRHFLRLFEDSNFRGEFRDVYFDMVDLKSIDFNDKTSSVRVMASQTALPTRNEQVISAHVLNANSLNYTGGNDVRLRVPRNRVNDANRLHVQGLGIANEGRSNERIVATACVANGPTSGCTGSSFALLFDRNGAFLDARELQRFNGVIGGESHPSAFQMIGNVFPVATAEDRRGGASRVSFFSIANDRIEQVPNSQDILVRDFHIGAIAYSNINGDTYLIGATWDAARMLIWRARGENRTNGLNFNLVNNSPPILNIIDNPSIDENWSRYNSIWLGKMAEDGRVVLFATYGSGQRSWADIWEVNNLNSSLSQSRRIFLNKIHKRWKDRWTTNRPYFLEGTVPIHSPNRTPNILALPDDFKNLNGNELYSDMKELFYGAPCSINSFSSDNEEGKFSKITPNSSSDRIDNVSKQVEITTYPNPTNGVLTIDIQGLSNIDISKTNILQVLDVTGQIVQELSIKNSQVIINTSTFNKGVYFIRLKTANGLTSVKQFIKL